MFVLICSVILIEQTRQDTTEPLLSTRGICGHSSRWKWGYSRGAVLIGYTRMTTFLAPDAPSHVSLLPSPPLPDPSTQLPAPPAPYPGSMRPV